MKGRLVIAEQIARLIETEASRNLEDRRRRRDRARVGLRHRGNGHHADHDRADLLRDPLCMATQLGAMRIRHRVLLRDRRHLLLGAFAQLVKEMKQ